MTQAAPRRQLNVYVPQRVHRWYRMRSVKTNRPMADLIRDALEQYIEEEKRRDREAQSERSASGHVRA